MASTTSLQSTEGNADQWMM